MDDFVAQIGRFTDLTYAVQASEVVLISVIVSVLVGVLWWSFAKSAGVSLLSLLLLSIASALLSSLAIGNITITLFGIGALLAFGRGVTKTERESLFAFLSAAIGIGVGSGYYFVTSVYVLAALAIGVVFKISGLENRSNG